MIGSRYKQNDSAFFHSILLGDYNIQMWINMKLCSFELIQDDGHQQLLNPGNFPLSHKNLTLHEYQQDIL